MFHPFGILNIDKPAGWTSRDVVNRVQRLVRPAKVGHAGTLDPLATGVLVVCVGPATRLIEYVQRQPKHYDATFELGRRSETDDVEGEVTILNDPPVPSVEQVHKAVLPFIGVIDQRPPAFSAVKVRGHRAYKLARSGRPVDLALRKVRIDEIIVQHYDYPTLRVHVVCGSGTYIRSLGRDLGEALGTAAVMSALCRTSIGDFPLSQAISIDTLPELPVERLLLPPSTAVANLPRLVVDDAQMSVLNRGNLIDFPSAGEHQEIAAFDRSGRLVAILAPSGRGSLKPQRNFSQSL